MALAAKAVAPLRNFMAAEVSQADTRFQGDAIFEKQGAPTIPVSCFAVGAHPLVFAQPRMQMG
jgi:hypothetical protein